MTRDELLEALLVERYDQTWWPTPIREVGSVEALTHEEDQPIFADNELDLARRRREMAADFAAHDHPERKAT